MGSKGLNHRNKGDLVKEVFQHSLPYQAQKGNFERILGNLGKYHISDVQSVGSKG